MANFWQSSDGRESGPTASRFGVPRNTAVISSMASSSPSDGTNDRCGNRSLMAGSSLGDFVSKGVPKYPAHRSRMRALFLIKQRTVLVHVELFASLLSTAQLNRALQVLVEAQFGRCQREVFPLQQGTLRRRHVILRPITPRSFAHAVFSAFHAVLSLLMRMDRRASSRASHATLKAAAVSTYSHQRSFSCGRRCGSFSSFASAPRTALARHSAMSEILQGWGGREASMERICSTTRSLQSPSDLNCCRSKGRIWLLVRTSLLSAKRSIRRTIACRRCYDLSPP